MQKPDLWKRLEAHQFDAETGSEPFSRKLAAAEGWSDEFTARAIEEYRRFLYLTQVSADQVTPSQIIDRVWHLHLTFTHDYWDVMCDQVLGARLHHDPCAGAEEMPRYNAQFAATWALYRVEFGEAPPDEFWPIASEQVTQRRWSVVTYCIFASVALAAATLMLGYFKGAVIFGGFAFLLCFFYIPESRGNSRSGGHVAGTGAGCGGGSGYGGGGCGG
ncbi:MAG: hypothetical protein AAFV19_20130 [Pseudomonadota bacterium]